MEKERKCRGDSKYFPLLKPSFTEESEVKTLLGVVYFVRHKFMEPLFDEYAERCSDEGDYEAEEPENVDEKAGVSRRAGVWTREC